MTREQLKDVRWLLLGALPGGVLAFGWLVWLARTKIMNSKNTGVWFVIAAVLFASIFLLNRYLRPPPVSTQNVLPNLQPVRRDQHPGDSGRCA